MELFNTSTREREDITDSAALQDALVKGTHSFKAGTKVPGLDPDGKPVNIPAESVINAIQSGYKVNTPNDNAVEAYVSENKGLKGAAKVFLKQTVDEAALGLPEIIFESTGDPLEVAKHEALKKEHEAANLAGGGLGFAASLLVGGPVWKAGAKAGQKTTALLADKLVAKSSQELSKSSARKIARGFLEKAAPKVGGGAVEGAVVSSPIAITEAMLGDQEAAAESLLAGIGIGGIFSGLSGASGALGSKFKEVAKDTKIVRRLREHTDDLFRKGEIGDSKFIDLADEKAFEALDPKKNHLKRVSANEEIIDEFGNAISLSKSRDTKKIGRTLREEGILDGLPDIQEISLRIGKRGNELSDDIASSFKRLDDTYPQAKISSAKIAENIRSTVVPELRKNKAISREINRFEKELDILADGNDLLTLTEANTLKSQYQNQIGDLAITESKSFKDLLNEIPKEFNRQIRDQIAQIDKKALDELIRKQKTLGNLRAAEKIAVDRAQASTANNDFGLTSFISGVGGASLFDGGITAVLAGLTAGAGREFTRRHGDLLLSKAYDRVGGLLFAEQAMKRAGQQIDRIPQILEKMANRTKTVTEKSKAASIPAIIRLFKEDSPIASLPPAAAEQQPSSPFRTLPLPKQKLKKLREETGTLVQNVDATLDRFSELTEPFANAGAPNIGSRFSSKMAAVVAYINNAIPKPPRPKSLFAPQVDWEPSDYEAAAFDEKLSVIMDPFVVLDELESGTLTRNHMDALKAIYPALYGAMQSKVQEAVVSGAKPVPYEDRVKLSLLMDAPMDSSLDQRALQRFQQSFDAQGQLDTGEAIPQGVSVNMAQSVATQAQRIVGG